jgi:hypothetical protein
MKVTCEVGDWIISLDSGGDDVSLDEYIEIVNVIGDFAFGWKVNLEQKEDVAEDES